MVTTPSTLITVNGSRLAYSVQGHGEPVLLIHGSVVAEAFAPLIAQPALGDHVRLVGFFRRGYGGSDRATGPFTIAQQAADCQALLQALDIEQAHVVGHSYGALIALQLAHDAPSTVHSLALLEPPLPMVPSAERWFATVGKPAIERYHGGDVTGAVDLFLRGVAGPAYRQVIDAALAPGAWQRVIDDAPAFFEVELPAYGAWRFGDADAARITQPVLAVLGGQSAAIDPGNAERHELVQRWFPQAEPFVLPGATHMLQMVNPADMAAGLRDFLQRHPLPQG